MTICRGILNRHRTLQQTDEEHGHGRLRSTRPAIDLETTSIEAVVEQFRVGARGTSEGRLPCVDGTRRDGVDGVWIGGWTE